MSEHVGRHVRRVAGIIELYIVEKLPSVLQALACKELFVTCFGSGLEIQTHL